MSDDCRFIEEVRMIADTWETDGLGVKHYGLPLGLKAAGLDKGSTLVDAKNTVIELGHPTTTSLCLGMVTERDDLIQETRVTVMGRELQELSAGRYPFALIALCTVQQADDRTKRALYGKLSACGHLAGVMARVALGRIWIRVGHDALHHEVTLGAMGWNLVAELQKYRRTFVNIEVMLVVAEESHINRLRPVADGLADQRRSQYRAELRKRMECDSGLACDECPETDTCRILNDAAAIVKKKNVM
ncbi:MAG: hypothetical protein HY912_23735 [Desulfomonile tiedjei]|uniref:CO-methylating acetyl-CoA synthase n=1 Tax=Desulfomonile tiedjei TaxID=2358 RepID=A0A9D6VBS0_9BACT|nr:hypothetical protein [Desulfomonile tiedjei]